MVCRQCRKDRPEEYFSWKNRSARQRQRICKDCHNRIYGRTWYQNHRQKQIDLVANRRRTYKKQVRQWLLSYLKTHPCIKCGESNPVVLEFDHLNIKPKRMDIGKLLNGGWPLGYVKEEISRCQVLCANCHRIKTAAGQGWFKALESRAPDETVRQMSAMERRI